MEFSININNIKAISTELNNLTTEMFNIELELASLCLSLKLLSGRTYKDIVDLATKEKKHIIDYYQDLKSLATSFNEITYAYLKTENNLVSAAQIGLFHKFNKRGENPLADTDSNEMDNFIQDFESSHPDQVANLNDFLDIGDPNNLTEDDIRNIKYLIYTAPEVYRNIYLNSISKFKMIATDNPDKNAFYTSWKHTITYSYPESFVDDPRGPYTVFFHESGHAIDDLSDAVKWLGSDTEKYKYHSDTLHKDMTMREAIEYDVYYNENNTHSITSIANDVIDCGIGGSNGNIDNVIIAFQTGNSSSLSNEDFKLYTAVKEEFTSNVSGATYESVSDVYGGVTNNELRSGYGHDTDYWDDNTKPAKELWAEFFSYNMAGDQTNLALLYEYFPEASKALDAYTNTLGEE